MWLKIFSILGAMSELAMLWEKRAYYAMLKPALVLLKIVKPNNVKIPEEKAIAFAARMNHILKDRVITHDEVVEICDFLGVELKLKV